MTPCPDLDRLVDDAVAGLPGAAERLAAHADACAACLAEADCAHAPVPEMALLAEAACPPGVLAAALATARAGAAHAGAAHAGAMRADGRRPLAPAYAADRAGDRLAPRRVWTRRVAAGVALIAALVVLRAVWPGGPAPTVAPTVATAPPAAPPARPTGDIAAATAQPATAPATAPTPRPSPPVASQRPAATAPRLVRRTPTAPAARDTSLTPRPGVAPPAVAPSVDPTDAGRAEVTPADSAAARQDLLLALAIVSRARQTGDDAVSAEMRRVSDALEPTRTL